MSPRVNSKVTKIAVTDGTPQSAVITVQLSGFEKGEYAQLSGFAAQRDGGFASISGEYVIGEVDPATGAAVFDATVTPMKKFVKNAEVTTSLWAAKVWLTVLDHDATGWAWNSVYSAPQYGSNWGS
jgi:hypothetical protein